MLGCWGIQIYLLSCAPALKHENSVMIGFCDLAIMIPSPVHKDDPIDNVENGKKNWKEDKEK